MPDSAVADALGPLPEWDLSDLYRGRDDPAIAADLDAAARTAKSFRERYESRLASLDGAALGAAVVEYDALQDRMGRLASYAQLVQAGDLADSEIGRFQQDIQERLTTISLDLLFFALELNRIEDATLARQLADPALARYRPWIESVRAFKPHQLSDEAERLLHEKNLTGAAAWIRAFDEKLTDLRVPVDGQALSITDALDRLTDHDGARRRTAAQALGAVFAEHRRGFALIANTLAKDKEIEDRWRRFARPVSSRNLANRVEDEVVEALVTAVKSAYPRLAHRYYALKARWFGGERLDYWDRNAPLPGAEERIVAWDEARDIVLDAYAAFSPELARIGRRFFDGRWIDAPMRAGKAPGAFAHPTVPSAHPYLLLNYRGRNQDVMTLAHELGHGVHQVLAAPRGPLLADTPLTLAETASVFGEMLTFRALVARETDPTRRRHLLADKVEDMLNTVVRQIAFHEFERHLHEERKKGELTAERIGELWMETQRESLGPALAFDENYRWYWCYVSHFVHMPFYVYAYAFGDCLVNSLYARYRERPEGFAETYLDLLAAGGTRRHRELLAPFGLDASDPSFWSGGLDIIGGLIDELERG